MADTPADDAPPLSREDAPPPAPLRHARTIAHVMDGLIPIPGTRWRVGLDPLLGLFPAAGDWAAWTISFYLVVSAARLGAGAPLLARMLGNILLDALTGTVPLLGDLFDVAWKANDRNLALLEAHVAHLERTARRSKWLVGGVLAGGAGLLVGAAWGVWWVLSTVVGLVF